MTIIQFFNLLDAWHQRPLRGLMNNYRGISLGVTFILLSICTRPIGAEETDRQALPPIQFAESDTRFTAANQERVDLVTQIPGLVALWDFVHRRDSWQTDNPFMSISGESNGRTYELTPGRYGLGIWPCEDNFLFIRLWKMKT